MKLKTIALFLVLVAAMAFAQVATEAQSVKFNDAYWAAQPVAVQELRSMEVGVERTTKSASLAAMGFKIDLVIHGWSWSPWHVMTLRREYGYTWTPNILQSPLCAAPGISFPNCPVYDPTSPPPGSVRVSLDFKDYPPVNAVPEVIGCRPVGKSLTETMYIMDQCDIDSPEGKVVKEPRGEFVKRVRVSIWGTGMWYDKVR